MLESTFQHIQGVGAVTERMLWKQGCLIWEDFLTGKYECSLKSRKVLKAGILESKSRLEVFDHTYFREALFGSLVWRAYGKFRNHACFLDIETTGLSPKEHIVTTVCVHSPNGTRDYVEGKNLAELKDDLDKFKYIITFNGARFDLPFLSKRQGIKFHQIHLDLMYPLYKLGFNGGLKSIEKQLGMDRDTSGVTGFDAVRLWKAYKKNKTVEVAGQKVAGKKALKLLIEYNRDDTVNLEQLTDFAVEKLTEIEKTQMTWGK
ncbi:MAG: ribonuclease H-like domain-containing protein [Methanobacteriota archaeon]